MLCLGYIVGMKSSTLGTLGFFVQVLALGLFSCGFFEFRTAKKTSVAQDEHAYDSSFKEPPLYDRLVFVLIDAMRSDFVYGKDSGFKYINEMILGRPEKTMSFIAKARPPTVTMPRLKALTAGSPPIFLDLILNFDETGLTSEKDSSGTCGFSGFTQDTWIKGLKGAGKKIVFYGDDTWVRLFPGCFDELHGVSSFFVQDYTHVDNQVTERMVPRLQGSDWDVLILHYLGMDHIGHIDGAYSKLMKPKQKEMDDNIRLIYESLERKDREEDRSSLLVVLGDHGMADNGNHGGSSEPEVNTAAIVFSPSKDFKSSIGQRAIINQVDFVPTLAGLFGIPVPESSTGIVIEDLIPLGTPQATVLKILSNNVRQLEHHLGKPISACKLDDETSQYECLVETLKRLAEEISLQTGDYNLKYMFGAILLTAICIGVALCRTCRWEHQGLGELGFVLIYVLLQSSSSFIEEEHEFWYFALASLISLRFILLADSSLSLLKPVAMLLLARIPRYWNATGYQRAQDVDARSWLPPTSSVTLSIMLVVLLLIWSRYKAGRLLKFLFGAASSIVFLFKCVQSGFIETSKGTEVMLARCCYAAVIGLLIMHLALNNGKPDHRIRFILAVLFLFLLKIHNAAIIGVLAFLGHLLSTSSLSDSFLDDATILAFIHYSYFALGPSNLLVSLDFSNAYIGLTQFNMVLISSITFLMTWSGPLMAALLFMEERRSGRKGRCLISDLALWRSFVSLGLLINLTIQRNHLFIWTVFAPRLLFEFGWAIFYGILLLGML